MDAVVDSPAQNGSELVKPSNDLSASKELNKPDFLVPPVMDRTTLEKMMHYCLENKADDLILLEGAPWSVIWSERVVRVGEPDRRMTYEELGNLLCDMTGNPNAKLDLSLGNDRDFSYALPVGRIKSVRFRCNATGCLGSRGGQGMEIVMRPSGKVPPTMWELGLPDYIINAALPKTGLILVCGPTGSGKTTLLDSIMRAHATDPMGKHILTYYAPIENDLNAIPDVTGLIAQCDIGDSGYGAHLKTFAEATRNSLRRHPMVIAYGEARDRETIEGAVLSAMTGHVTYTTTHTSNTHMAIPRMSDMFSGGDRVRVSNGLIDNSRLIVHQRLVRRASGIGRAPIRSALALTQDIRAELLRTPVDLLPHAIFEATNSMGLGLLEDAERQFKAGVIHQEELDSIEQEMKMEKRNLDHASH